MLRVKAQDTNKGLIKEGLVIELAYDQAILLLGIYPEKTIIQRDMCNPVFIAVQISQEAGQVVWYSHLIKNFPQFIVIHTVKGFGIVNKAEVDVFLESSCFYFDPTDVGNLISGSSAFSKTSLNIWKFTVHV